MEQADATEILDAKVRVPDHVVYRAFAAETVALNIRTGRYHGLNPVAGRMLEAMTSMPSVRVAAESVAKQYGQPRATVEEDMTELCSDLEARGLIVVDRGAS